MTNTIGPLRVLHVGKFYPPSRGGMEKVLQVLAEGERAGADGSVRVDNHVLVANEGPSTIHEAVNGVMPIVRRTARFNQHRDLIVSLLKHPPARRLLFKELASRSVVSALG